MSATTAPGAPKPRRIALARSAVRTPAAELVAFGALAVYVSSQFANLETSPPQWRVVATVLAATLGGAALTLTGRARRGRGTAALRVTVMVLTTLGALALAGVAPRLLWPPGWGGFVRLIGNGLGGLTGDLWPYRGADPQVRLVVLLAIPVSVLPAAGLAFWPGSEPRRSRRRIGALAVLVTMYVLTLVNQHTGAWVAHGLALLALLAAWGWLASLAGPDTGRALAWVAMCALVGVILAAALRPPAPLLQYRNWDLFGSGGSPIGFQWDQQYGPIPWSRSTAPMFEVSAPVPQLWKVTTLDRFDGVGFLRSDNPPVTQVGPIEGGAATYEQMQFTMQGLRSRLLAGAGELQSVDITASEVARTAQLQSDGTGRLTGVLQPGDSYTAVALIVRASPARLRRASAALLPAAYHPFIQFQLPPPGPAAAHPVGLVPEARPNAGAGLTVGPMPTWHVPVPAPALSRIDASPYARMFRLARRLAAGLTNSYDVAERIAGFLRRNYVYDERPPVSSYPIESFLFQDGVGYCQQFSAAMTLLLRMDGIPARVAEGFLPGTYDAARRVYRVTALDAHAWVEVYFPGLGWQTFDPTPPRRLAPIPGARLPAAASLAALGLGTKGGRSVPPVHELQHLAAPVSHAGNGSSLALVAIAIALLAAGVLIAGALFTAGTRRLRHTLHDDGEAAVSELARALRRLGYVAPSDLTLTQLARRLEATHGAAAARYVQRLAQRRFAAGAGAPAPTAGDRRALRRALVSHGSVRTRLRALLVLPPALPTSGAGGRPLAR